MKRNNFCPVQMGKRIQLSRKAKRITQEQLAEIIDISPNNVSRIENATMGISLTTLTSICTALDVSADYILFGNDGLKHQSPTDILLTNLSEKQQIQAQKLLEIFVESHKE